MDVGLLEHNDYTLIENTSVLREKTGLLTQVILLLVRAGASLSSLRIFVKHIYDRGHNFVKVTPLACF